MILDKKGKYNQETAKAVKVSYEIAMLIAMNKKPHAIGENLVKPCIVNAVKILLGDDMAKQFKNISFSDSTVKRRIDELADDIKQQVLEKVKCSPFLAISCDESTDQANCAQLIVYARFIANNTIEEKLLFSEPLKTTTKGADVFQAVSQFFGVNSVMWETLVGVCTDGAPAMLGSRSGFVKMVKSKNPSIFAMHCAIHRQALVAKTLPDDLREDLNFAVEVVNYVKRSALNTRLFASLCESLNADHMALLCHTEVRWLSKGNMLGRIYELREAVAEFLEQRGRRTVCRAFKSEHFQLSLAYLADIFEALNSLNLKLQGANANVMAHYDIVQSFTAKISLWHRNHPNGIPHFDLASFGGTLERIRKAPPLKPAQKRATVRDYLIPSLEYRLGVPGTSRKLLESVDGAISMFLSMPVKEGGLGLRPLSTEHITRVAVGTNSMSNSTDTVSRVVADTTTLRKQLLSALEHFAVPAATKSAIREGKRNLLREEIAQLSETYQGSCLSSFKKASLPEVEGPNSTKPGCAAVQALRSLVSQKCQLAQAMIIQRHNKIVNPDLVLVKDGAAHIVDVAVPWEKGTTMDEKHVRKVSKYTILTEDVKALFGVQTCTVGAIIIGARSSWCPLINCSLNN
ncbi:Uncharacterized protein TSPI_10600 [Trichinella spiralis]|uniref:SCAN domain-containing protein 3 n=1 Tax=Trichinella spiralis TaxID=6334 RepID=A0ABR3KLV6_TRISP